MESLSVQSSPSHCPSLSRPPSSLELNGGFAGLKIEGGAVSSRPDADRPRCPLPSVSVLK